MSGWAAKRFWKEARVVQGPSGWEVRLDDRPVKTPAKAALALPSRALAEGIAAEWDAQVEKIDAAGMPLTRAANSAIDKVTPQRAEVAAMLAAYGESDLLCYRAEAPEDLARRQAEGWDPLLDWSAEAFGAPLTATIGVIHIDQSPESLVRLRAEVEKLDPFALTAFHDLVALTGSLVIGLAALHGRFPPDSLWQASRIDETWQAETWGHDDEAAAAAERKRVDFIQALRFLALCTRSG